jgi:hypothetical protein
MICGKPIHGYMIAMTDLRQMEAPRDWIYHHLDCFKEAHALQPRDPRRVTREN